MLIEATRLEKVTGSLAGIKIGDGRGMPWETMTHQEIIAYTKGRGVTYFYPPVQTKITDTGHLEPGESSDDWMFAHAVLTSILRSRGFDVLDCMKGHIELLTSSHCGMGKDTAANLRELQSIFSHNWVADPQLPVVKELQGEGVGNGIAMKIAPLALFSRHRLTDFLENTKQLGKMTHKNPQAWISAYALGLVINRVFYQSIGRFDDKTTRQEIMDLLDQLTTEILLVEQTELGKQGSAFLKNLLLLNKLMRQREPVSADVLRESIGTSFHCFHSIPFAIGTFLRHPTDFEAGVTEAIEAGGDTDTNAAMVGAMIGANSGFQSIPRSWRNFRPDYQEPVKLGEQLYQLMFPNGEKES